MVSLCSVSVLFVLFIGLFVYKIFGSVRYKTNNQSEYMCFNWQISKTIKKGMINYLPDRQTRQMSIDKYEFKYIDTKWDFPIYKIHAEISFQEHSLFLKEINRIEAISGQGRKTDGNYFVSISNESLNYYKEKSSYPIYDGYMMDIAFAIWEDDKNYIDYYVFRISDAGGDLDEDLVVSLKTIYDFLIV